MSCGTLDPASATSISPTGLSPCIAALPNAFGYRKWLQIAVRTPGILLHPVWPFPRSLATTYGISVDFSSSPYLDVSVQAVPHLRLFDSTQVDRVLLCRVSPFGNLRINAYLQLPAAYRSLSRPSSAPSAKAFPLRSSQLDLRRGESVPFRFRRQRRQKLHCTTSPLLLHKNQDFCGKGREVCSASPSLKYAVYFTRIEKISVVLANL